MKQKQFYYIHKLTGKFVYLNIWDSEWEPTKWYIYLLDEFNPDILYSAKNVLIETLEHSIWSVENEIICNSEIKANPDDFELKEVEIIYNLL